MRVVIQEHILFINKQYTVVPLFIRHCLAFSLIFFIAPYSFQQCALHSAAQMTNLLRVVSPALAKLIMFGFDNHHVQ